MHSIRTGYAYLCILIFFKTIIAESPLENFFANGVPAGDIFLAPSDDGFEQVVLGSEFKFLNNSYNALFVDVNGAISFVQGIETYTPECSATSTPTIAPFLADIDITYFGNISYRESKKLADVQKATIELRKIYNNDIPELTINWVFIVTWSDVPFYGEDSCGSVNALTNTFQATLATDGTHSFVLLKYNRVSWTTGTASGGDCNGTGGVPAKVGFDVGDQLTIYSLPTSCTPSIIDVDNDTNIGISGEYIFRVDTIYDSAGCGYPRDPSIPLQVTPLLASYYGHVAMNLKLGCVTGATNITCSFLHPITSQLIVVPAVISSTDTVSCIAPYVDLFSKINVSLTLNRIGDGIENYYAIYSALPPVPDLYIDFNGTEGFIPATISWDPNVFGSSSILLDLILVQYVNKRWIEILVCLNGTTNSGVYNGTIKVGTTNISALYMFRLTPGPTPVLNALQSVPTYKPSTFSGIQFFIPMDTASNVASCLQWFQTDSGPPTDATPCPPTLSLAQLDPRFIEDPFESPNIQYYHPGAEKVYIERILFQSPSGAGQECAYSNGSIILGPPGGGTTNLVSPYLRSRLGIAGMVSHFTQDVIPWTQCCKNSGSPASCSNYYIKRPSNSGRNYKNSAVGKAGGDPHLTTLDGLDYTFNPVGEFWLVWSNNSTGIGIQVRMEQWVTDEGELKPASVITALVFSITPPSPGPENRFHIFVSPTGFSLYNNYVPVDLTGDIVYPYGVGVATLESPSKLILIHTSGFSVEVTIAGGNRGLNILPMATASLRGALYGLLGRFDGDPENDFQSPDGSSIAPNSTTSDIHYYFGSNWRVNATDSKFIYPTGKDYFSYQNESFVPNFEGPSTVPPQIAQLYSDCPDCLFDWDSTGSILLANDTLELNQRYSEVASILGQTVLMCPDLQAPTHGTLTVANYLEGSTATFDCDVYYTLIGSSSITCKVVEGNPVWNDTSHTCVQTCPTLTLANGSVTAPNDQLGSNATFSCDQFYTLNGNTTTTCEALEGSSPVWTGTLPVCEQRCPNISAPVNGSMQVGGYTVGSNISFSCSSGYALTGTNLITCLAVTENYPAWSDNAPVCQPICSNLTAPGHGSVQVNSYFVSGNATFSCDQFYTLNGNTAITCQAQGGNSAVWSGTVPVCEQRCANILAPGNGSMQVGGYTVGSNISFSCNSGFALTGTNLITCLAVTGNYPAWSDNVPICQPRCSNLTAPAHGSVQVNSYLVGGNATFTCDHSYVLNGYQLITCQQVGSNSPAWNHASPTCTHCDLNNPLCITWAALCKILQILPLPLPPLFTPPCCPYTFY